MMSLLHDVIVQVTSILSVLSGLLGLSVMPVMHVTAVMPMTRMMPVANRDASENSFISETWVSAHS